jgi:hypothetical protein
MRTPWRHRLRAAPETVARCHSRGFRAARAGSGRCARPAAAAARGRPGLHAATGHVAPRHRDDRPVSEKAVPFAGSVAIRSHALHESANRVRRCTWKLTSYTVVGRAAAAELPQDLELRLQPGEQRRVRTRRFPLHHQLLREWVMGRSSSGQRTRCNSRVPVVQDLTRRARAGPAPRSGRNPGRSCTPPRVPPASRPPRAVHPAP